MGAPAIPQQVSGNGGTTVPPSSDTAILGQMLDLLLAEYGDGKRIFGIDYLTITTAGTVQSMYAARTLVRRAVIMNVSTVAITLFGAGTSAGRGGTANQGIILNAAAGSGSAGGSITVDNIDLSFLFWVGASGAALAVYYEY